MIEFITQFKQPLINSIIVFIIFLIVRLLLVFSIRKIGRKSDLNTARIRLIARYTTVTLLLIFLVIETFIFGANLKELSIIFSSVFTVIGIGLFAVWSILSNVTSGIIMFFSFPYKVGDKIKIHDKDFPIEAIIEDIRAFQLHLRLDDGNLVTYPNNLILQKPVSLIEKDAILDVKDDNFY